MPDTCFIEKIDLQKLNGLHATPAELLIAEKINELIETKNQENIDLENSISMG